MKKFFAYAAILLGSILLSYSLVTPALAQWYPVGGTTYYLKSSIASTDTSITLSSFNDPISNIPLTMAYMGSSIQYATIEPLNSSKAEFISFTGDTENADGSMTLTGVTRGLSHVYPYSASSTLASTHAAQSQFILSISPPALNTFNVSLSNPNTWTGLQNFANASSTLLTFTTAWGNYLALGNTGVSGQSAALYDTENNVSQAAHVETESLSNPAYALYAYANGGGTTNYGIYTFAGSATTNWGLYVGGGNVFLGNGLVNAKNATTSEFEATSTSWLDGQVLATRGTGNPQYSFAGDPTSGLNDAGVDSELWAEGNEVLDVTANQVTIRNGTTHPELAGGTNTGSGLSWSTSNSLAFYSAGAQAAIFNPSGNFGIGTSTPVADFQVATTTANATTTAEFGKSGQSKGTCLKLYRTDGTAIYAYVAAGATTFTLSTTACATVTGF